MQSVWAWMWLPLCRGGEWILAKLPWVWKRPYLWPNIQVVNKCLITQSIGRPHVISLCLKSLQLAPRKLGWRMSLLCPLGNIQNTDHVLTSQYFINKVNEHKTIKMQWLIHEPLSLLLTIPSECFFVFLPELSLMGCKKVFPLQDWITDREQLLRMWFLWPNKRRTKEQERQDEHACTRPPPPSQSSLIANL